MFKSDVGFYICVVRNYRRIIEVILIVEVFINLLCSSFKLGNSVFFLGYYKIDFDGKGGVNFF